MSALILHRGDHIAITDQGGTDYATVTSVTTMPSYDNPAVRIRRYNVTFDDGRRLNIGADHRVSIVGVPAVEREQAENDLVAYLAEQDECRCGAPAAVITDAGIPLCDVAARLAGLGSQVVWA